MLHGDFLGRFSGFRQNSKDPKVGISLKGEADFLPSIWMCSCGVTSDRDLPLQLPAASLPGLGRVHSTPFSCFYDMLPALQAQFPEFQAF